MVSGVQYGVAGQLTQMAWGGWTEARSYNERMQLTRATIGGVTDYEYTFSATANNGQIAKSKDWITGEEVNFTSDSLKRLVSASTTGAGGWGTSYVFDGFGNLEHKTVDKGWAPSLAMKGSRMMRTGTRCRIRAADLITIWRTG